MQLKGQYQLVILGITFIHNPRISSDIDLLVVLMILLIGLYFITVTYTHMENGILFNGELI